MRISDWSSDVCSSDLVRTKPQRLPLIPFVLSVSKHRPFLWRCKERTALRQAQGERVLGFFVALCGSKRTIAPKAGGPSCRASSRDIARYIGSSAAPAEIGRAHV